ncbi:MAG: hypothetical protein ACE5KY_05100 [Candidatus Tectimicrobiota bacterium]
MRSKRAGGATLLVVGCLLAAAREIGSTAGEHIRRGHGPLRGERP